MNKAKLSRQRRRLWQVWRTAERLIRRMQQAQPMCPGSYYLLQRRCGKPSCRCRQGALHTTWVVTRSEEGRVRLYHVPEKARTEVKRLTAAYRDWQQARAALVKLTNEMLRQLDALADGRLQQWPPTPDKEINDGFTTHRTSSAASTGSVATRRVRRPRDRR